MVTAYAVHVICYHACYDVNGLTSLSPPLPTLVLDTPKDFLDPADQKKCTIPCSLVFK